MASASNLTGWPVPEWRADAAARRSPKESFQGPAGCGALLRRNGDALEHANGGCLERRSRGLVEGGGIYPAPPPLAEGAGGREKAVTLLINQTFETSKP